MPEIIIKYKSSKTLEILKDLAKYFDFNVQPVQKTTTGSKGNKKKSIPIDFAEKPDIEALAGIWKDKDITLEQLRKKAWGDRL